MRTGRPTIPIGLTPDDCLTLERYARRPTTAQALALRIRIVLRAGDGVAHTLIAQGLRVTPQTVGQWRRRFASARVAGPEHPLARQGVRPDADGGGSSLESLCHAPASIGDLHTVEGSA